MATATYRRKMVKCGKPSCAACRAGPSHGPYWYACWRDADGRRHTRYVGKTRPPDVEIKGTHRAATTRQPLHIRLLGGFEVRLGDRLLDDSVWSRPTARALLALLLLHPDGLTREEAAEALWPDRAPQSSRSNLNAALTGLRHAIDPMPTGVATAGASTSRLPARRALLRLELLPQDTVDLRQFHQPDDPSSLDRDELEVLADFCRGEFLPEYRYEAWTIPPREALRERWRTVMRLLATRYQDAGQTTRALGCLESLLAAEPTDEEAARECMQLLAAEGRRDEALRRYACLRSALQDDLDVEPDTITEQLANRLREQQAASLEQQRRDALDRIDRRIHQLTIEPQTSYTARGLSRLWVRRALLFNELSEPEAALSSVKRGRSVLRDHDLPAEEGWLCWAEALANDLACFQSAALELANQARDLARRAGDRELETRASITTAHVLEQLGRPEDAVAAAQAACELADALDRPELQLHARRVAAVSTWRAGRLAEAEILHRRNVPQARELGKDEWEGYILCGLAAALLGQGKLDETERTLAEAFAVAQRTGDSHLVLYAEYYLGNLWRERAYVASAVSPGTVGPRSSLTDARHNARAHLERSLRLAQGQEVSYMILFSSLDLASALLEWGDTASALPLMEIVREEARSHPSNETARGWVLLGEANFALALGALDVAVGCAADAIDAVGAASPAGLAEAHRVAALASVAQHDAPAATHHWKASRDAAVRYGQKLEETRTRRAYLSSNRQAAVAR